VEGMEWLFGAVAVFAVMVASQYFRVYDTDGESFIPSKNQEDEYEN